MIPASDASLENEDLSCEDSVAFLFQEKVMSVLEEDLRPAKLIVSFSED